MHWRHDERELRMVFRGRPREASRSLAAARRGSVIWKAVAGILIMAALQFFAVQPARSDEVYLLGAQDKVRLKIYEWRPTRDTIFEWKALNDIFTVGADGTIAIPFAGNIAARGASTRELADRIAAKLKENMGLGRAPDVTVEIAQYRPFYVVGYVNQPGEFPYRPGLTALQALGIAGGLKTRQDNVNRIDREIISGNGDIDLIRLNKINLLARKARLEAEQSDAQDITFPKVLVDNANDGSVASAMQEERAIFETRRKGQATQLQALSELHDFLQKELESLKGHLEFQDRQIELLQKDLDGIAALVKKGFATESRQTALERSLVQARSDRLTVETSLFKAQQEISRTELNMLDLKNNFANDVRLSLRDTQSKLYELDRRAATTSQLLYESEVTAPRLLARQDKLDRMKPVFKIVRNNGDRETTMDATENTLVQPGDTIKIDLPLDPNSGVDPLLPHIGSGTSYMPTGDTANRLN